MFECQRHTQSSKTVLNYDDLLVFLDLCARVAKNVAWEGERNIKYPSRQEGHQKTVICSKHRR